MILLCVTSSCENFINTVPKGQVIPKEVNHYLQLMEGLQPSLEYMELSSPDTWLPDNDIYYSFDKMPADITNRYIWDEAEYIFGLGVSDNNYDNMYNSIYIYNVIIDRVLDAVGSCTYTKEEVQAMAKVHRAASYFALVEIYGKQYNPTTANTDLGVVIRNGTDINEKLSRATVQEVYDYIIKDLTEAASILTDNIGELSNRPSKGAAYGMLSRVYLFMGEYDKAYEYADLTLKTIEGQRAIIDYNTIEPVQSFDARQGLIGYTDLFPSPAQNTEVIYARSNVERWTLMSEELSSAMPEIKYSGSTALPHDLRKIFMVSPASSGLSGWYAGTFRHHHLGIDVSEMILTRAEAAIRKSTIDLTIALSDLNEVRRNRICSVWYEDCKATTPADILAEILLERRLEFYMTYMSFFDMKRQNSGLLGSSSTAKDFTRSVKGTRYTMTKNSDHYTYLIPFNAVAQGGYEQNPGW